ncbi:MAG: DUF1028 domain-containing protein [Ignavibacteriales bacterium]|nr:DUF1028 domain-containing protein [Ignavibacteriales bacterium]
MKQDNESDHLIKTSLTIYDIDHFIYLWKRNDGMNNTNHRITKLQSILIVVFMIFIVLISFQTLLHAQSTAGKSHQLVETFSIVGRDSVTSELGVAVASRFFAVGSVVPWAKADVGAVATQSFVNTSFGWRGLDLLEQGATAQQAMDILLKSDPESQKRQCGIVSANGTSATHTGSECLQWAGGRSGSNYAIQGNILAGEAVVIAMESAFLNTKGTLAERLYAALLAGDSQGGDSRGKQSAALLVVKKNAGYGGYTDRAIDIRVDDNTEPFRELGRLLNYAQMNYSWNEAWTLFMQKEFAKSLPLMERTALLGPENAEVLYDLAVIRLAAGKKEASLQAVVKSLRLNPKLKQQASKDPDLKSLQNDSTFQAMVK